MSTKNQTVHGSTGGHHGTKTITGTTGNDNLHGGDGVVDINGWAGDDVLYASIRGGAVAGGAGNDTIYGYGFGADNPQQYQTHLFGDGGNDTFNLNVTRQAGDHHDLRFGHHAFGGQGADRFVFAGVNEGDQRIIGRIDDFDASQDSLWIDDQRIDLHNLPAGVRVVSHLNQQWLLINDRILYSLEGARHGSPTIDGNGRNSEASEENHFINWPEKWLAGVPLSADVRYSDPVNFVPARYLPAGSVYDNQFRPAELAFYGTEGADYITGSPDHGQNFWAGDGNDYVFGNRGDDTVFGGTGRDWIDGYHGNDKIYGGFGIDVIDGGKGHDLVFGGYGNDVIAGGSDNDTLHGGPGHDTIFGGSEDDLILGGYGDDRLYGGPGQDRLFGSFGRDVLHGDNGRDTLWGGLGEDTLLGGDEDDRLHGGGGNDRLFGGNGKDCLIGNLGADLLMGGRESDRLHGNEGNDQLFGNWGDDILWGGTGNDRLHGGYGNDTLYGGPGADRLQGGMGADHLHGGSGADVFVFASINESLPGQSRDTIFGFSSGEDRLDLSTIDANTKLGGQQQLSFSESGPAAHSVWHVSERGGLVIRADVNGDGLQDIAFLLAGVQNLNDGDVLF